MFLFVYCFKYEMKRIEEKGTVRNPVTLHRIQTFLVPKQIQNFESNNREYNYHLMKKQNAQ